MEGVIVVIPSASVQRLKHCLRFLFTRNPELPRENVIVVWSGEPEELFVGPDFAGVTVLVQHDRPFRFTREVNMGLKHAGSHDVLLLNDDAHVITNGLIKSLSVAAAKYGGRVLLTPSITGRISLEGDGDWAWRYKHDPGLEERQVQMIPFMAAFLPAALREEIGLLDERFTQYGSDDDDYSYRVRRAGYPVLVLPQLVVHHEEIDRAAHRAAWGAHAWTKEGRIDRTTFIQKWGAYPPPVIPYIKEMPVHRVASTPAADPAVPLYEAVYAADKVPGWMGVLELLWLAEQASKRRGIVEFGSLCGRSARAMGAVTPGTLWCVDVFDWAYQGIADIWTKFQEVNGPLIKSRKIVPLRMRTQEATARLVAEGAKIDMVFIDADHSRAGAEADIKDAIRLLGGPGSGGLLCGHDMNAEYTPGVVQAVRSLVPGYRLPTVGSGSIWAKIL